VRLKYSADPDKYGSHERILEMLRDLPAGSSVLDVASAVGYFGERLAGRSYYVVGVEQDQAAASVASFYDEFIVSDVESQLRLSRKFDVIVLADRLRRYLFPLLFPSTREEASCYFLHRANWAITQMWKRLFAYQLIHVAVPAR